MPETINISVALKSASLKLIAAGINDPARESNSLLALALGKNLTFLIAHPEYQLTDDEQKVFDEYLRRRAAREPFQYISGHQEFYGLDFIVTPDVLIPRPETEMIVETALKLFAPDDKIFFCEIGMGSGCIAVAILHEMKNTRAIGVDISQAALNVAEKNAISNGVVERLELGVSDIFSFVDDAMQFDLIVSNPPYIPASDMAGLQLEVRDHEPHTALTDNADGLSIIAEILKQAPPFLKPGGFLLMEIGAEQAIAVSNMLAAETWQEFEILDDLQGIPRVVKLQK